MSEEEKKFTVDTNIIIKAFFKPKNIPSHIIERELETHEKCRLILSKITSFDVYVPYPIVIETASVIKRLTGNEKIAKEFATGIENSFTIIEEAEIKEIALDIACKTGASGLDTYFLAVAKMFGTLLISDDEKMVKHAETLGIPSVLVREKSLSEIQSLMEGEK